MNFLVFETYALIGVTVHRKRPKLNEINIKGHYMLDDASQYDFDLI